MHSKTLLACPRADVGDRRIGVEYGQIADDPNWRLAAQKRTWPKVPRSGRSLATAEQALIAYDPRVLRSEEFVLMLNVGRYTD